MDNKRLTGFVLILGIVLMLFIGLCALCSCTTKSKVITEYVAVHDTIHSHHTDTVHNVQVLHLADTVRMKEEHIVTLSAEGQPIKEVNNYYYHEKETIRDSTNYYRAERDSLQSALHEAQQKEKVVVKKASLPWWVWVVMAINVPTLIYIVIRKLKSRHHE